MKIQLLVTPVLFYSEHIYDVLDSPFKVSQMDLAT